MIDTLSISGPAELLSIVPQLLGFEPTDSLVLIFLNGSKVLCTARITVGGDVQELDDVVSQTIARVSVQATDLRFVAVFYCETPPPLALDDATDVLHVHQGSFHSLRCTDPICCPPQGQEIKPSASAMLLVTEGLSASPSRSSVEEEFAPADVEVDATSAAQAIGVITVRDRKWTAIDALDTATEKRNAAIEWLQVARHSGVHAAPAYFLAGWGFWRAGDGARAAIALDHVQRLDPDYGAAQLLERVVTSGINPHTLPALSLS